MITDLILPLSIVFGLFNFVLITRWYVMPRVRERNRAEALTSLLLLHSFRWIRNGFPDPRCHYRTSGRQILKSSRLRGSSCSSSPSPGHRRLERQLDNRYTTCLGIQPPGVTGLMNALAQGVQFVPNGHFGVMYFIPAIIVPASLVSHGVILLLLIGRQSLERD